MSVFDRFRVTASQNGSQVARRARDVATHIPTLSEFGLPSEALDDIRNGNSSTTIENFGSNFPVVIDDIVQGEDRLLRYDSSLVPPSFITISDNTVQAALNQLTDSEIEGDWSTDAPLTERAVRKFVNDLLVDNAPENGQDGNSITGVSVTEEGDGQFTMTFTRDRDGDLNVENLDLKGPQGVSIDTVT